MEIAKGPLIEAIDEGSLTVCPQCLFVNYAGASCQICEWQQIITYENIADYLEDLSEESPATPEKVECEMILYRAGRAVDLFDRPDMSYFSARMLYNP